jgi:hypothetical protein
MLKKILIGIGIFVLVIVGAIVAAGVWAFHARSVYADTAVPYIKKAMPALTSWDPAQLKLYMDPAALKDVPDDKVQKMEAWMSTLGDQPTSLVPATSPRFE